MQAPKTRHKVAKVATAVAIGLLATGVAATSFARQRTMNEKATNYRIIDRNEIMKFWDRAKTDSERGNVATFSVFFYVPLLNSKSCSDEIKAEIGTRFFEADMSAQHDAIYLAHILRRKNIGRTDVGVDAVEPMLELLRCPDDAARQKVIDKYEALPDVAPYGQSSSDTSSVAPTSYPR